MRLDFNVLWVDDQPDRVAAQSTRIAQKMSEEGFELKCTPCATMADIEKVIAESVFKDEVDLILVDWDLGNGLHGEEAINRIRQIVEFKDVIFYSGQATVTELRQKVFDKNLEGVFCASRTDLVDEVIGVFDSLIKKVLDLDHTRGIVMGATSDIEHMVDTCLALAHEKLDEIGKADFIGEAMKQVEKQVKRITKLSEKLKKEQSIQALFEEKALFSSIHRLRLLEKILDKSEFSAIKQLFFCNL